MIYNILLIVIGVLTITSTILSVISFKNSTRSNICRNEDGKSCVGPQGLPGPAGTVGKMGPAGPAGKMGAQGQSGLPGPSFGNKEIAQHQLVQYGTESNATPLQILYTDNITSPGSYLNHGDAYYNAMYNCHPTAFYNKEASPLCPSYNNKETDFLAENPNDGTYPSSSFWAKAPSPGSIYFQKANT